MRIVHKRRLIWIGGAILIVAALSTAGYLIYRHHSGNSYNSATSSSITDYRTSGYSGTGITINNQSDTGKLAGAPAGFKLFIWQEVTRLRALAGGGQLAATDVPKYQAATATVDQIDGNNFAVGTLSPIGRVLWANVDDTWKQISVADQDGKFDCTAIHKYSVPGGLTSGGQCVNSTLLQS